MRSSFWRPSHSCFYGLGSEFNGRGQFLTGLNTPDEVYPPVAFMTTRSDANDELLSVFRELVSRMGQAPQARGLSPEAAAVVKRFAEFENQFTPSRSVWPLKSIQAWLYW